VYNENDFHFQIRTPMTTCSRLITLPALLLLLLLLPACDQASALPSSQLDVVATTTLVGDVVRRVGGDNIAVSVLLPVGSDPHSFEPVPKDLARLADADLVFANGAGLEEFLNRIIENSGGSGQVVSLSDGLELIQHGDAPGGKPIEEDHDHPGGDPHVWTDPDNVSLWAERAAQALSEADPANAATYRTNAAAYQTELAELDGWIQAQVAQIPPEQRRLVTDHETLNYFARRYGFETVGAVIPGFSSLTEPSAQELAALEDAIRGLGVKAIFVDSTVNPALAERVAQDTGTRLVQVYSGSLSAAGGEAETYLDYMRYNTSAIVSALR
jgi:ABC-type Zn uptake system ZnuABC Zn-binding protein ZnuA